MTSTAQQFALAPFGGAGGPAYGGIGPMCQLMLPNASSCYSSNPINQPLDETYACGGEESTQSAFIVACDTSRCAAQIFSPQCGSAYPDLFANVSYPNTGMVLNASVMGSAYQSVERSYENFGNLQYDYTVSLETARTIVQHGHIPILDIQMVLFDQNGLLRSDAVSRLQAAITQYPDVFNAPGLMLEVFDEPFWNGGNPSSGAQLQAQISAIHQAVQILRQYLPKAILGLTQAGIWSTNPTVQQGFAAVAPDVDVLITDVYGNSFDPAEWQYDFQAVLQFALQQKQANPGKPLMFVLQGFSPNGSASNPLPTSAQMTPEQLQAFELYMTQMFGMAKSLYQSVMVWGWGFSNELSDAYDGKHFIPALVSFYQNQVASFAPNPNSAVSASPTLPIQGQWTVVGNASPEKILFFTGPQNMNGYCDLQLSGAAAPYTISGTCWTWAGQSFSASGLVGADGSVTGAWTGLPGGHSATLNGALSSIGASGSFSVHN